MLGHVGNEERHARALVKRRLCQSPLQFRTILPGLGQRVFHVGRPLGVSESVPVTVKSLMFPAHKD